MLADSAASNDFMDDRSDFRGLSKSMHSMNVTQELVFVWSMFGVVVGILATIITGVLCWLAWQRSGFAKGTGILESIRFLLVVLVSLTLNQPEILQESRPTERPTLAVVYDESNSMLTKDVIDPKNPTNAPRSRSEWIEPLLKKDVWKKVSKRYDVVFEPFSSTEKSAKEATDLNGVLTSTLSKYNNLQAAVLFSDGDWNVGDPPIRAATQFRMKNKPIFTIGVGSATKLPDVEIVSVDAPTFGVIGKSIRVPYVIQSSLPRDHDVVVTMQPSKGEPIEQQVRIPAMGTLQEAFTWLPDEIGDFKLTVSVPKHDSEVLTDNNSRTVPVSVRKEAIKVLLIEAFPRWEYRYLRNALERDPGVDVSCLLFHPTIQAVGGGKGYLEKFPDKLTQYDVVFLGDVGVGEGQLTVEQCRQIKGLVQNQASGLIFMPGFRGAHFSLTATELDDLYPVTLDESQVRGWGSRTPAQFELTDTGRTSLLTKLAETEDDNAAVWRALPGFQWYAPVLRARAGTEVLAVHKTQSNRYGRVPLLVTRTFGTGKSLFMGTDGAWRWREGVEDKYHYRFWGQVARWMAYQRNIASSDMMRLFFMPDRPRTGTVVTLNANVMGKSGEPLQNGKVIVQVVSPTGETETVRLSAVGEEWGLFTGRFTPKEPGEFQLIMTCKEIGSAEPLKAMLSVQGVAREKLGQPARYDVLKEIATVSRGSLTDTNKTQTLLAEIADMPEPDPIICRVRIWSHIAWASFLVFLLAAFWIGRKLNGVI